MHSITTIIRNILTVDEVAYEALRQNLLNCNAYARKIHNEVEDIRLEKVQTATIGTILRRIQADSSFLIPLKPEISISHIGIKSSLYEVTYPINNICYKTLSSIIGEVDPVSDFFTFTRSTREITFICSQAIFKKLKSRIKAIPICEISNLGAITTQFPEKYFSEPNLIFTLISQLAIKRIDLVEVISTYTEIVFVVKKQDLTSTFEQLQKLLK